MTKDKPKWPVTGDGTPIDRSGASKNYDAAGTIAHQHNQTRRMTATARTATQSDISLKGIVRDSAAVHFD